MFWGFRVLFCVCFCLNNAFYMCFGLFLCFVDFFEQNHYLFLTYSVFSPESLPVNYKGTIGPKDGTPVIIEVQRAFHNINPENQRIIRQWIRPLPKKPTKRQP